MFSLFLRKLTFKMFSNSSSLKTVFKKVCFCDVISVDGKANLSYKAEVPNFSGVLCAGPNSVSLLGKVNWGSLCHQLVIMQLEYSLLTQTQTR